MTVVPEGQLLGRLLATAFARVQDPASQAFLNVRLSDALSSHTPLLPHEWPTDFQFPRSIVEARDRYPSSSRAGTPQKPAQSAYLFGPQAPQTPPKPQVTQSAHPTPPSTGHHVYRSNYPSPYTYAPSPSKPSHLSTSLTAPPAVPAHQPSVPPPAKPLEVSQFSWATLPASSVRVGRPGNRRRPSLEVAVRPEFEREVTPPQDHEEEDDEEEEEAPKAPPPSRKKRRHAPSSDEEDVDQLDSPAPPTS